MERSGEEPDQTCGCYGVLTQHNKHRQRQAAKYQVTSGKYVKYTKLVI